MLFSSTIFIFLFLPAILFFYYVVFRKSRTLQNVFLFLASLLFYAWGEPVFVLVMLLSIFSNYLFGLLVDKFRNSKTKSRIVLTVTVVFNLSVLYIFKYLVFTVKNINSLTDLNFTVPDIALPIGISFFTFQAMSYVIDVYRKDGEVQYNPLNVGLYIAFFPQLIAGPIVRYQTIADQIKNRKENIDDFSQGICRFVIGLSKKVLLANTLALVADKAFAENPSDLSVAYAWLGAVAYTFQIFFDFSGYSDMAIGLGKMFGFHFLENFDYPYLSQSISEFWRRWHISLGTWFRDYVYFPLGGSRVKSKTRLIFNLFVVWFLTGVWHGANWTFIIWGLMYFVLLAIEKLIGFDKKFKKITFIKRIYTLLFVILGWVLFRSEKIVYALDYIKAMFGAAGNTFFNNQFVYELLPNTVFFAAAAIASTPFIKFIDKKITGFKTAKSVIYVVSLSVLLIISLSYIIKGAYNPFIYFNF